jgi:hypothetical protein
MQKPGVPVDGMLRKVRQEVVRLAKSVGHEQVPALYDQTVGEFYLNPKESSQRHKNQGLVKKKSPKTWS